MFEFIRQLTGATRADSATGTESIVMQEAIDRRKISGVRATCTCEFTLSNPDLFTHYNLLITGVIVLNVRGCGIYPEQKMSEEEFDRHIPQSKVLQVTKFVVTGSDGRVFSMSNVSIRRVRLLNDEHGQGAILRFVDLDEAQLDTLNQITNLYSDQT